MALSLAPQYLIKLSKCWEQTPHPPPAEWRQHFRHQQFHCRVGNSEKTSYSSLNYLNLHETDPRMSSFVEFHIFESFIHFVRREIPILDDWQAPHSNQLTWTVYMRIRVVSLQQIGSGTNYLTSRDRWPIREGWLYTPIDGAAAIDQSELRN